MDWRSARGISDVSAQTALETGDSQGARKGGAIPLAQRAGGSRKHLPRRAGDRVGPTASADYLAAGADRSLQADGVGVRNRSAGGAGAAFRRLRTRLLRRDHLRAS